MEAGEEDPGAGFKQNWKAYVGAREEVALGITPHNIQMRRLILPILLAVLLILLALSLLAPGMI